VLFIYQNTHHHTVSNTTWNLPKNWPQLYLLYLAMTVSIWQNLISVLVMIQMVFTGKNKFVLKGDHEQHSVHALAIKESGSESGRLVGHAGKGQSTSNQRRWWAVWAHQCVIDTAARKWCTLQACVKSKDSPSQRSLILTWLHLINFSLSSWTTAFHSFWLTATLDMIAWNWSCTGFTRYRETILKVWWEISVIFGAAWLDVLSVRIA